MELFDSLKFCTANVNTLYPRELAKPSTNQACGSTSRMLLLDDLFWQSGAHVVSIQEARIPGNGHHCGPHYTMSRAGSTEADTDGSQMWVQHELKHLVTAVKVLSPRLIRVVVEAGPFRLHFVSGHAPIEAAPAEDKAKFWQEHLADLETVIADKMNLIFLGLDANARVGSVTSEFVGGVQPDDETDNGLALRLFATELKLTVVNAFSPLATPGPVQSARIRASTTF